MQLQLLQRLPPRWRLEEPCRSWLARLIAKGAPSRSFDQHGAAPSFEDSGDAQCGRRKLLYDHSWYFVFDWFPMAASNRRIYGNFMCVDDTVHFDAARRLHLHVDNADGAAEQRGHRACGGVIVRHYLFDWRRRVLMVSEEGGGTGSDLMGGEGKDDVGIGIVLYGIMAGIFSSLPTCHRSQNHGWRTEPTNRTSPCCPVGRFGSQITKSQPQVWSLRSQAVRRVFVGAPHPRRGSSQLILSLYCTRLFYQHPQEIVPVNHENSSYSDQNAGLNLRVLLCHNHSLRAYLRE